MAAEVMATDDFKGKCYFCREKSHKASECPRKMANLPPVSQVDDQEVNKVEKADTTGPKKSKPKKRFFRRRAGSVYLLEEDEEGNTELVPLEEEPLDGAVCHLEEDNLGEEEDNILDDPIWEDDHDFLF